MSEKAKTTNNGSFLKLFKNTHSTCFIMSKNYRATALEFLNLIKHCSCFRHYFKSTKKNIMKLSAIYQ